jgi:hypothetical protein
MKKIISSILKVCNESKNKTLKSGSNEAIEIKKNLYLILDQLKTKYTIDEKKYDFHISLGFGYFPKIPWAGITKKGQRVSAHKSVCMCFSPIGEGFVFGAMAPFPGEYGKLITITRNPKEEKIISLIGGDSNTSYNNKFFNPLDFFKNDPIGKKFDDHFDESIRLLN